MSALLSHAELTQKKASNKQSSEARRAMRCTRHGNLTLFPRVELGEPVDAIIDVVETPRVIASISNVSTSGVGLIVDEELPSGMEFDVEWPQARFPVPLRFEVVHSRPVAGGMYRTGARLVAGILPAEPVSANLVNVEQPDEVIPDEFAQADDKQSQHEAATFADGVLMYESQLPAPETDRMSPTPPGTLRISSAFGMDKTEKIDGVTTCGWERSISLRRDGNRLWLYIHSPGKKNGWGLYVDPDRFEAALDRVQQTASSPFITTLAA